VVRSIRPFPPGATHATSDRISIPSPHPAWTGGRPQCSTRGGPRFLSKEVLRASSIRTEASRPDGFDRSQTPRGPRGVFAELRAKAPPDHRILAGLVALYRPVTTTFTFCPKPALKQPPCGLAERANSVGAPCRGRDRNGPAIHLQVSKKTPAFYSPVSFGFSVSWSEGVPETYEEISLDVTF